MAIKTQIRLVQVTGSVVDFKPGAITQGATAAAFSAGDLSGSLQYFAQAISNIHGKTEFGNQQPGLIQAQNGDNYDLSLQQLDAGQKVSLISAGTGVDSIQLNSSAGGMLFTANTANKKIELKSDALLLSGSDTTEGLGHGIMLVGRNSNIALRTDTNNRFIHLSGSYLRLTGSNASARGVQIYNGTGGIEIGAATRLLMSGSSVIVSGSSAISGSVVFSTDGGFTGTHQGGMNFADNEGEFISFRAKAQFGATTSVIGAFNALADSVVAFEPTLFAVTLGADINAGDNVTVAKIAGDSTNLVAGVGDNKAQVFVNGQLMRSSSGGETNDYAITSNNVLQFQFLLQTGDIVQVSEFA